MEGIASSIQSGGLQNWFKLSFAILVVKEGLTDYINSIMSELYLSIFKKCAKFPNCTNACFQKVKNKDNWCAICATLKDEIIHNCRHKKFAKNINWEFYELEKLLHSSKEMMKIFVPDRNESRRPVTGDITAVLFLFHNCKAFDNIPLDVVTAVRKVRNKYFAHNPELNINDNDLKKCMNRLYTLVRGVKDTHSGQKAFEDLSYIESLDVLGFLNNIENNEDTLNIERHLKESLVLLEQNVNSEDLQNDQTKILLTVAKQMSSSQYNDKQRKHGIIIKYLSYILFFLTALSGRVITGYNHPVTSSFLLCCIVGWMFMSPGTKNTHHRCASMKYTYPWTSEVYFEGYNLEHEGFVGRDWLFDDLERYLLTNERGVFLTADMGYGKTALFSNLLCSNGETKSSGRIQNKILAFHMCKFDVLSTQKPVVFIRNIVGKIASEIPEFGNIILSDETILKYLDVQKCSEDPYGCIDFGLIQPLNYLSAIPEKVVLVVEALDECVSLIDEKNPTIVKLLSSRIRRFPSWIHFLFISRNISSILDKFRTLKIYHLDSSDKRNMDDILYFINMYRKRTNAFHDVFGIKSEKEIVQKFLALSQGNFLFIRHSLIHWTTSSSLDDIPLTLGKIYEINFESSFGPNGEGFENAKVIFEILSTAYKPLTEEELIDVAETTSSISEFDVVKLIRNKIGQYIIYRDGYLQIAHKSIQDWLTHDERKYSPFRISKANGHSIFSSYLFKLINKNMASPNIISLAMHVAESGSKELKILFRSHAKILYPEKDAKIEPLLHYAARHMNHYQGIMMIHEISTKHIDVRNSANVTALFIAAAYGHAKSMNAFLDLGSNPLFKVENNPSMVFSSDAITFGKLVALWGYNLLHIAAQNNHKMTVKKLLTYEKSLMYDTNSFGLTPFQLAAERGNIEIMQMFLTINKSLVDDHSLYYASSNGHVKVVKLLLKYGSRDRCLRCDGSVYWINGDSWRIQGELKSVLHFKTNKSGNVENITKISSTFVDDWRLISCETSLHAAVKNGYLNIVKLLLNKSKNTLECVDYHGNTPLYAAVRYNRTGVFQYLVKNGANLSHICEDTNIMSDKEKLLLNDRERTFIEDLQCRKSLHLAHILAIYDRFEMGLYLIENRFSNWNPVDIDNSSALHYAACYSSYRMVILLAKMGLRTDARAINGSTPFHSAVSCKATDSLLYLKELGKIDSNLLKDNDGRDLLHYAFLSRLLDEPQEEEDMLSLAVLVLRIYKTIYMKEYNFLDTDTKGKIALHYGMLNGHYQSISWFFHNIGLEHNFTYWKDRDNNSLLDLAFKAIPSSNQSTIRLETNNELRYILSPYEKAAITLINTFSQHRRDLIKKNIDKYIDIATKNGRYYVLMALKSFATENANTKALLTLLLRGVGPIILRPRGINGNLRMQLISCKKSGNEFPLHDIVMNKNNKYWFYSPSHSPFLDIVLSGFDAETLNQCVDNEGYNLLHRAAIGGHSSAVRYLIKKGMDTTKRVSSKYNLLQLVVINSPYESYVLQQIEYVTFEEESFNIDYYNRSDHVETNIVVNNSTDTNSFKDAALFLFQKLSGTHRSTLVCKPGFRELSVVHIAAAKGLIGLIKAIHTRYGETVLSCSNIDGFSPLYLAKLFNQSETVNFLSNYVQLKFPKRHQEDVLILKLMLSFKHPFPQNSTMWKCLSYKDYPPLSRNVYKKLECNSLLLKEIQNLNKNKSDNVIVPAYAGMYNLNITADLKHKIKLCLLLPNFYNLYMKSSLSLYVCSICPGSSEIKRLEFDNQIQFLQDIASLSCRNTVEFCNEAFFTLTNEATKIHNKQLSQVKILNKVIQSSKEVLFDATVNSILLNLRTAVKNDANYFLHLEHFYFERFYLLYKTNRSRLFNQYFKSEYLDVLKIKRYESHKDIYKVFTHISTKLFDELENCIEKD